MQGHIGIAAGIQGFKKFLLCWGLRKHKWQEKDKEKIIHLTAEWEKHLLKKKNKKKSYAKLNTRSHLCNLITYFRVYEK